MREIKFRVYDIKKNRYFYDRDCKEWFNGDDLIDEEIGTLIYTFFKSLRNLLDLPKSYRIEQFTGVYDSSGKEIYEGDLVIQYSDEDTVYEVKWIKAYSGYQWCLVDTKSKYRDEPSDYYGGLGSCLKVVGNIFNGVESKSC